MLTLKKIEDKNITNINNNMGPLSDHYSMLLYCMYVLFYTVCYIVYTTVCIMLYTTVCYIVYTTVYTTVCIMLYTTVCSMLYTTVYCFIYIVYCCVCYSICYNKLFHCRLYTMYQEHEEAASAAKEKKRSLPAGLVLTSIY